MVGTTPVVPAAKPALTSEPFYVSTAFWGAVGLLIASVVQAVAAVRAEQDIDWLVWAEGALGLVVGIIRTIKGLSAASPTPRLTLGATKGKAAVVALALTFLLPGCAGGLTQAQAGAIVETGVLVAHGVDVWCRPEVLDVNPDLCAKARTWSEVVAAIVGIVVPGLVPAEASGVPKAAEVQAKAIPLTCDQANVLLCVATSPVADTAGCKAAREGCRRGTGAVLTIPLLR